MGFFLKTPVITAVEELTTNLFGGNQSYCGLAYAGICAIWMITVSLCVLKPVNLISFSFLSHFSHNLLYAFFLFDEKLSPLSLQKLKALIKSLPSSF